MRIGSGNKSINRAAENPNAYHVDGKNKHRSVGASVYSNTTSKQPSISELNAQISGLEQKGAAQRETLDALNTARDEAITRYTGASDASAYDYNIVAAAQTNNRSYNREVDARISMLELAPHSQSSDRLLNLPDRIEHLPWEQPVVNARVDELTSQQGLSYDAAVVIAMTERTPNAPQHPGQSIYGQPDIIPGMNINNHAADNNWQAGFANRVVESAAEITTWASNLADSKATGTLSLTTGDDRVTISQQANGMLVVKDDKGILADQIIDPAAHDRIIILGDDGNDRITIDKSVTTNMVVAGGNGNDKLFGGGGKDILIGGNGDDILRGATGTDIIIGGAGDDNMEGGNGADLMYGQNGADYASGGLGNDLLVGGSGRDSLYGGKQNDIILGQTGNDNINGGNDSDYLLGESGNDVVIGGKGDDYLFGNEGTDTLIGASGDDRYPEPGFGDKVIVEAGEFSGAGANRKVVEIDHSLGSVENLVLAGSRSEFITRIDDDIELLRSTQSGQAMLTGLAENTANTGNTTIIREIDSTKDQVTIDSPTLGTDIPLDEVTFIDVEKLGTEISFVYGEDIENIAYGATPSDGGDADVYMNLSYNVGLSEVDGQFATPPVVLLFHELSHAFNVTSGTALEGIFIVRDHVDEGVPNLERQAVGLDVSIDHDDNLATAQIDRPNHVDQPTENDLRRELGISERISYLIPDD